MSWLMVYFTVAFAMLSLAGAWCCIRIPREAPSRLAAVVVAAALWPIVVLGLAQLGVIALYAKFIRRQAPSTTRGTTTGSLSPDSRLSRVNYAAA